MKIVFFGTPDFVVPIVERLHKDFSTTYTKAVVAVVTQPPKPAGRTKQLEYSAVDKWAFPKKIPVLLDYDNLPEADIAVVAAYGRIIPEAVINHFPKGVLNVHPSLLPALRGASPIQGALATDLTQTGVTIIKMDALMDHGAIVSSFKENVEEDDTNETLRKKLFDRVPEFLSNLIPHYLDGKIQSKEQNHESATYTKLIQKEHGFIPANYLSAAIAGEEIAETWEVGFLKDYSQKVTSQNVHNFIRSLYPWPTAWTTVNVNGEEKRLKIISSHLAGDKLVLDQVQLEGKNAVSWEEFKKGYPSLKF